MQPALSPVVNPCSSEALADALACPQVPLWICATCEANGRKVVSLPKAVPRKKHSATGSASVKVSAKAVLCICPQPLRILPRFSSESCRGQVWRTVS